MVMLIHFLVCEYSTIMGKQQLVIGIGQSIKWIGAGAMAYGGYLLGSKFFSQVFSNFVQKKQKNEEQTLTSEPEDLSVRYGDYYFDRSKELDIILNRLQRNPSVQRIYLQSLILAQDQFYKYTQEIRKRRRLVRKVNEAQYINLVLDYEANIENLLTRCRLEILDRLGISQKQFQKQKDRYDVVEGLKTLQIKCQNKLRSEFLKKCSHRKMSTLRMNLIVDELIFFVDNKFYARLRSTMQDEMVLSEEQILRVSQTLLEDFLYEKYGYEWEDLEKKLGEHPVRKEQSNFYLERMSEDINSFNFDGSQSTDGEEAKGKQDLESSSKTITKAGDNEQNYSDI